MSESTVNYVREFHQAFKVEISETPNISNKALNMLRLRLIQEELDELKDALFQQDEVAVLDALTDIQYVLDGTYLSLGFAKYKNAAVAEVHRSNMSKLGSDGKPIHRDDGKVLKSKDYTPPNLRKILEEKEG